jgi:hypothetical protein
VRLRHGGSPPCPECAHAAKNDCAAISSRVSNLLKKEIVAARGPEGEMI